MNEPNQVPPVIPQGTDRTSAAKLPLGTSETDQLPITGVLSAFEAILRQPRRVLFHLTQSSAGKIISALLLISFCASLVYGVVVGTFSGHQQLWIAPVKVTLGLLVSAGICLPSLYIFACLSGSQARLVEVAGLVAGLLALMTILLIGFAPVAWIFSQSTNSIVVMGFLHLAFFGIATYFGLRFLKSGFNHFSASFGEGIQLWIVIFLVVVLQMSTALRPIIGTSENFFPTEKKFFVGHWMDCLHDKSGDWQGKQDYNSGR